MTACDSLDTMLAIPDASQIVQASTVHDQRLSECPETPKPREVLPYSRVTPRSLFFSFLQSQALIQPIPDVTSYRWLILIPYCMLGAFARNVHLCIICQVRLIDLSMYYHDSAMHS